MLGRIGEFWRGEAAIGRSKRGIVVACVAAVAVVSVTACGSAAAPAASAPTASAPTAAGSAQGANIDAARTTIAPFIGQPSKFPVTEPLSQPLAAGKKFVFLQCSSPVCGQVVKSLEPAIAAIGASLTVVNAGETASSLQTASSSTLAMKPDAVIVTGSDPALYGGGLKALSDAGARVVSISVAKDVQAYGVTFNYIGLQAIVVNGTLLADWVVANKGAEANTVFYGVPGLEFSDHMQQAFVDEMKKQCPACAVRDVPIDVTTIGKTAPQTVVTDLQAHPETNTAVFASYQVAGGLPAALKAAGRSVTTVGYAPTAGNLQDIKDGGLTAGLAIDFPVSIWTAVDSAARLVEGDQPTQGEQAGQLPEQFLEQKDITFDPANGWTGYPDFAQRYTKLWHPGS